MTVYGFAVSLRVMAALGLFAGVGPELAGLRRASTHAQAREWAVILGRR